MLTLAGPRSFLPTFLTFVNARSFFTDISDLGIILTLEGIILTLGQGHFFTNISDLRIILTLGWKVLTLGQGHFLPTQGHWKNDLGSGRSFSTDISDLRSFFAKVIFYRHFWPCPGQFRPWPGRKWPWSGRKWPWFGKNDLGSGQGWRILTLGQGHFFPRSGSGQKVRVSILTPPVYL